MVLAPFMACLATLLSALQRVVMVVTWQAAR